MSLSSLNFLLLTLFEEGAKETTAASPSPLLPLLLVGVIFWFILIAPERKKRKQREKLMEALKKGDRVLTTSGIHATIVQIQDDVATLQIADGVRVKFSRAAIQGPLEEDGEADAKKGGKHKEKQAESADEELAAQSK